MNNKDILICGGGTAGWMAAHLMINAWPDARIRLIESDHIGIIGVGEGSTPMLKTFFEKVNIKESEWMPACNATYKVGINFVNWSERPDYQSYFHPFFSELDIKPAEPFFYNAKLQKAGVNAYAHPDHYFVTAEMARKFKAPKSTKYPDLDIDYGYHFDSGLLGAFLREKAIKSGLSHIVDDIESVNLDNLGRIQSVSTKCSGELKADLYVDCTGFRSLLLQQALAVPFNSYQENLFNDSAVTIATGIEHTLPVETKSTALSAGWAWRIPLTNRFGNGYVYSSRYITEQEAEDELKAHLNIKESETVEVRHLKMKVGRVEQHWYKNCLAVGLSQGFIEPLEATALMLVQHTIEEFIEINNDQTKDGLIAQQEYNAQINKMMEGIRDYIVTHYVTNTRNDSLYWQDCRNAKKSSNLTELLEAWDNNENFETTLNKLDHELVYLRPSWYVLLMGVGRFTEQLIAEAPIDQPVFDHLKSKQYCQQLVNDIFLSHRTYLQNL